MFLNDHPKGLFTLFFSEMWERFSFYGMRALLVFYMTKVFLFSDHKAYGIYGGYMALVYATPFIGGWISDKILGNRKAVILGGILMSLGHFAMAISNLQVFYLALSLIICGNGFFKPNISTIVGQLYKEHDPRRDGGFTIFYMGINLGAMLAPLLCGIIGEKYGWHYGFTLAGFGMILGLVVFVRGQKHLGDIAKPPHPEKLKKPLISGSILTQEWLVYICAALSVIVIWQLVQSGPVIGHAMGGFGLAALAFVLFYLTLYCDKVERDRLLVALVLIFFSMVFWSFFEQAGSSMNLFTDRNIDRHLFNWVIPASVFQSANPFFILILAPLFSSLWIKLAKKGKEPSTPVKFSMGIFLLGLGFITLWYGAYLYKDTGTVPMIWIIAGYFFHTTGELCLSPVGLSMITKLSPLRIGSLMMGFWFLATALSEYIAGMIARLTGVHHISGGGTGVIPPPVETVMVYGTVFQKLGVTAMIAGLILFVISPLLKKGMHGA